MLVCVLGRSNRADYLLVPLNEDPIVVLHLCLICGLVLILRRQSFTLRLCHNTKNRATVVPMQLNLAQVSDDLTSLAGCNLAAGGRVLSISSRRLDILLLYLELVGEQVAARVIVRCEGE